ncbi:MAG: cellulase family glycosylhydrolase, partial [Myxococcales bacterium]
ASGGAQATSSASGGASTKTSRAAGGEEDSQSTTEDSGGADSGGSDSGGAESGGTKSGSSATSKGGTSATTSAKTGTGGTPRSAGGSSQSSDAVGGSTPSTLKGTGATPVERHGQLKVSGSKLLDEAGNPVQLKGPSSMWLNWESQKYAEDKQGLQFLRDNWNASVVRAAMGVETTDTKDSDYLSAPDVAKAQVNQIVQNAIDLGMYVIIDWHDGKADTRVDTAKAFFKEMATKWGAYPNVLYETFNEPTTQAWETVLKPYHEAVIAAIREVDPDNIIIRGTRNWSQYVDEAAQWPVKTSTNLMYTLHFYSCTHDSKIRTLGATALKKNLPLFVTEWGATHADGGTTKNPNLCLEEAQLWHDWMNENSISWAAWKWDRCVDTTCYFTPSKAVPTTGPWTDDMLYGHAAFVRDRMRE